MPTRPAPMTPTRSWAGWAGPPAGSDVIGSRVPRLVEADLAAAGILIEVRRPKPASVTGAVNSAPFAVSSAMVCSMSSHIR